jgi:thiol-disulfide isomerase/thioredoxin
MNKDEYKNTNVKELSSNDYKITNNVIIKNNKKSGLVVFYNFWCGYCQMVKPIMINLTKNKKYNFYAVHGENPKNQKLFGFFQIQGVPQIRYVHKNGKIGDIYNGERTEQSMLQALMKGGCPESMKGGGERRRKELKNLTKPVLLRRIRKHEKKVNKKAKINMSHKKQVMINYIDNNIEERRVKIDLRRNKRRNIGERTESQRESRKNQLRRINANKKKNRANAKALYKEIPKKDKYISIKKHNLKKNKKLKKKEPMKFIKMTGKTKKIYKNSQEKIEYKIKNKKNKIQLDIVHKQGDEKIKMHQSYPKNNNSLATEYEVKKDLLEYVRNTIDSN